MAYVLLSIIGTVAILVLWLWHIDRGYKRGAAAGLPASPDRWTDDEITKTCERLSAKPLDWKPALPPAQKRRYIVIGGAGGVGGTIVLHLLLRGQSPKSIRILDFRKPTRDDLLQGDAGKVEWVQTDITSEESTKNAFLTKWDKSVADLPLTVFHTAALINAAWRNKVYMKRVAAVNVLGTVNVITACKSAGADILIGTSSGAVPVRPIRHWLPPWKSQHDRLVQPLPDPGQPTDVRDLNQYFSVYAATKARAEQITVQANSERLRTGAIRPCNGIYGNRWDMVIGSYLKMGEVPLWHEHVVQCYVRADNVSLAHLDYEAAILQYPHSAGKCFNVTDAGKPITSGDIAHLLEMKTQFKSYHIPSTTLFPMAYAMEWYDLLRAYVPALGQVLPPLPADIGQLQPAIWTVLMTSQTASNAKAALPPEKGGIGYKPVCTILEGMCQQVLDHIRDDSAPVGQAKASSVVQEVKNAGALARG